MGRVFLTACFLGGVLAVSPVNAQDIYDGRAHGAVTVSPGGYGYAATSSSSLPQYYPPPPGAYTNYRPPNYGQTRLAPAAAAYGGYGGYGYAATSSSTLPQYYPPPPSAYVGYGGAPAYNPPPRPYARPVPATPYYSAPAVAGAGTLPPALEAAPAKPVSADEFAAMDSLREEAPGNIYYAFDIIGGASFIRDHALSDSSGRDTLEIRHEDDLTLGNSLAVGYDWKDHGFPIRTELEAGIRYRFDLDYRAKSATDATLITGYATNLATIFAMINAYYDFHLGFDFRPYVGAGIGWARHRADTERNDFFASSIISEIDNTDNFTWSLMGGVIYDWTRNWGLGLEGRFTDLGDVSVGPFGGGDKVESRYYSFDVVIGVTYTP
ncbi:MAG: outer membrane beta-barrel protein [Alphaproteobacteria bacterium]|nr:outer membrane beta-barrel protein [Alphaproteobacteria bacterium]